MTKVEISNLWKKEEEDASLFIASPADLPEEDLAGSDDEQESDEERAHSNLIHDIGEDEQEEEKTRVMTLICTAVTYRHCPFVLRMSGLAARIFLSGSSVDLIHILSNERWSALGVARRKVNVDLNVSWSVMVAGTRPVSTSTLRTCSFLNVAMVFDNCAVTVMISVEPYTFGLKIQPSRRIKIDRGPLSHPKTSPS
ncbi:uncharacterized protein [Palaemon carinicauda]|uniref:uncharacterized protein n=1 Tax=Palaemon carinicauda TaxID=392227 RepID=UPI0035B59A75